MRADAESSQSTRPSTIRDVAARAGVSKSTASRVLLGGNRVSPENLEKVQQAIKDLDFVPNQIARSLTVQSPALFGLFLRSPSSPFYAHFAEAFEQQASRHNYEALSVSSGDQPDDANYRSLMVLAGLRTAGIAVAAPIVQPSTIRQIANRVPLVLVGQMGQPENPDVPFVAPDPTDGETLIEHLTTLGHRSIALTAFPAEQSPTQWARVQHMEDSLTRQGLLHSLTILEKDVDMQALVKRLHSSGATAMLCNNDWVALDAIAAGRQLHLDVPGDLSIAGHDGVPPFSHEAVGLTTYRVPIEGMATQAVVALDQLVQEKRVSSGGTLLKGQLLVGSSTGPVRPSS